MRQIKLILILSIIIGFSLTISAQDAEIKQIRKQYYSVTQQINDTLLYINEITINKNGKTKYDWPAVGYYYEKFTFYYDTPPAHWDGEGKKSLVKITIDEMYSAQTNYIEMLFDKGKLIFAFVKDSEGNQHRYYFANEKLIGYTKKIKKGNTEISADIDKAYSNTLQERAESLQQLFLSSTGLEY